MMGRAMNNLDMPANKRISGLLFMPEDEARRIEPENCIRCAKCVGSCPMGLEPYVPLMLRLYYVYVTFIAALTEVINKRFCRRG